MISKIKGLFVNNKKAQDSIYESGVMVFDCLKLSDKITIDYIEVSIEERSIALGYDFYFFNYHPSTMSWLDTKSLKKIGKPVIAMVLEVLPGDPFVMCPENHFNAYCVLDPSLRSKNSSVFSFPRPLEKVNVKAYEEKDVPVIGSFGFATKGKGFHHVVESVNKEFDKAIIKINIPFGHFVPDSEDYARFIGKLCKEKAKDGIDVRVTHDYMTKPQLIEWCAENTLNCFLYDRNMPGLAATTDQAIASGRPLAVSQNDTFRHILSYLAPYPAWSLKRSIEESAPLVEQMQKDWEPRNFALKFENLVTKVLSSFNERRSPVGSFEMKIAKNGMWQKMIRRYKKYKRLLAAKKIKQLLYSKSTNAHEELI